MPSVEGSNSVSALSTGIEDVNASIQFILWFKIGFILYIINMITSLIGLIGRVSKSPSITSLFRILSLPLCCGFIAFIIAGMVLRWRHVGQVCSGAYDDTTSDLIPLEPTMSVYMKDSSNFLRIYSISMGTFCGLITCTGCLLCTFVALCYGVVAFGMHQIRGH